VPDSIARVAGRDAPFDPYSNRDFAMSSRRVRDIARAQVFFPRRMSGAAFA
jgi:hypothetical protein